MKKKSLFHQWTLQQKMPSGVKWSNNKKSRPLLVWIFLHSWIDIHSPISVDDSPSCKVICGKFHIHLVTNCQIDGIHLHLAIECCEDFDASQVILNLVHRTMNLGHNTSGLDALFLFLNYLLIDLILLILHATPCLGYINHCAELCQQPSDE